MKMAYDPSSPAQKTPEQIAHQIVDITQRDGYFSQLTEQGWEMVGNPIQFPGNSDPNTLRSWAKQYASTMQGELVVEVNDPAYSQEPSNTLVFFIWRRIVASGAAGQAASQQTAAQQPAAAGPTYANPTQVLQPMLWRLANILFETTPRIQFQDTGELLYPFILIRMSAYEHLGGRIMDLYLVKDGIYDYKILGNETHGKSGGQLTPYRDEIISFKTLGKPTYMILDEFDTLDQTQQSQVVQAIQAFLTQY
jgi:hypothetical protein